MYVIADNSYSKYASRIDVTVDGENWFFVTVFPSMHRIVSRNSKESSPRTREKTVESHSILYLFFNNLAIGYVDYKVVSGQETKAKQKLYGSECSPIAFLFFLASAMCKIQEKKTFLFLVSSHRLPNRNTKL